MTPAGWKRRWVVDSETDQCPTDASRLLNPASQAARHRLASGGVRSLQAPGARPIAAEYDLVLGDDPGHVLSLHPGFQRTTGRQLAVFQVAVISPRFLTNDKQQGL